MAPVQQKKDAFRLEQTVFHQLLCVPELTDGEVHLFQQECVFQELIQAREFQISDRITWKKKQVVQRWTVSFDEA